MFRTLLLLILLLTPFLTFAATPGTVEYFVHNSSSGKPFAIGRVPNHPWPATTSSPPFTFGTMTKPVGSTKLPTYMPQRITPASFARGMFNAIVRGHPVAKAAVVGWAVYECATAESGLCAGGQIDETCPAGGTYYEGHGCGVPEQMGEPKWQAQCRRQSGGNDIVTLTHADAEQIRRQCEQLGSGWVSFSCGVSSTSTNNGSFFAATYYKKIDDTCSSDPTPQYQISAITNFQLLPAQPYCPEGFSNGPANIDGSKICFAPLPDPSEVKDVTLDDLRDWMAENPYIFDNLPDDVLKDHNTGKPDDTFFDRPKHTPISPPLSDAFESLGTGLAQDNNPSAPHYIPPELKPEVEAARDKFHQGEPFTDPFTNTTVTPEPTPTDPDPYTPPAEVTVNLDGLTVDVNVDMKWDEFPGLTQDQYEESNDKLATAFEGVEMPGVEQADSDFIDSIGQNPDLPFSPFDFGTLWPITGGQCTGFVVTMAVRGDTKAVMMDKHCPPYNEWAHPLIAWFLQLLTALHIFHLFSRMLTAG